MNSIRICDWCGVDQSKTFHTTSDDITLCYVCYKKNDRHKHKDQIRAHRNEYFGEHKEEIRLRNKQFRLTPEGQFSYLKSNAKRRGIEVSVSFPEFASMRASPCYYCKESLPKTGTCIDRLDSNKGYIPGNCVPCCHRCNYLKGNILSKEEAQVVIPALMDYRRTKIVPKKMQYHLREYKALRKRTDGYNKMLKRALAIGVEVDLSEADYKLLTSKSCTYCTGHLPYAGIGLDRVDSKLGYTFDNCVPCCSFCNDLKGDLFTAEETFVMVNALQKYKMSKEGIKCWQRHLREEKLQQDLIKIGLLDTPDLKIGDFKIQTLEDSKFQFAEAKLFIEEYEWMKTLPQNIKHVYIAEWNGHLAGVQVFSLPYSRSKDEWFSQELLIARGACISWSPKNLASHMLMTAIRDIVKRSNFRVFSAYADPKAGELGSIYQACNFMYIGGNFGSDKIYKDKSTGKLRSSRYFTKCSTTKRICKRLGIEWGLSWNLKTKIFWDKIPEHINKLIKQETIELRNSFDQVDAVPKHKYCYALGPNKRETRLYTNMFLTKHRSLQYPKDRLPFNLNSNPVSKPHVVNPTIRKCLFNAKNTDYHSAVRESSYNKCVSALESSGLIMLTTIGEYTSSSARHKMLTVKCKFGHVFERAMERIKNTECPECTGKSNKGGAYLTKINQKRWELISGEYKNKSSFLKVKCKTCGKEYTKQYRFLRDKGCDNAICRGSMSNKLYSVEAMPKVATFKQMDFYIVGRLGKHQGAYVKVRYNRKSANILIKNPEKAYNFGIPDAKLKIAKEWVANHKDELIAKWDSIRKKVATSEFHGLWLSKVKTVKNHLLCKFSNGEFLSIDFTPFKKDFPDFSEVKLIDGIPSWPSGIDLDPDELYELGTAIDSDVFNAA